MNQSGAPKITLNDLFAPDELNGILARKAIKDWKATRVTVRNWTKKEIADFERSRLKT